MLWIWHILIALNSVVVSDARVETCLLVCRLGMSLGYVAYLLVGRLSLPLGYVACLHAYCFCPWDTLLARMQIVFVVGVRLPVSGLPW